MTTVHENKNATSWNDRRLLLTFVRSIVFGLAFIPVVVAALFGWAFFDWRLNWSYLDWATFNARFWPEMYEFGGFPCVGLPAIMASTLFATRLSGWQFVPCLLAISTGAYAIMMAGGLLGYIPRMEKLHAGPYWLEPAFLGWLVIPSWIVATILIAISHVTRPRNPIQPPPT